MIKRILVALDPDTDTPIATRYAVEIARRYDAEVTGLAVVDMGNIEAESRGGGIGSMYYSDKLRDRLTEEARKRAGELIAAFEDALESSGVPYGDYVKEGVPFERILEDMKYHDLLVVGRTPHFFYSHPTKETRTLARVVKETIAPTFVVGDTYHEVERVLLAYDGSTASARTMQRFVHLQPFGPEVEVLLLHVRDGNSDESELMLQLAVAYLEKHGLSVQFDSIQGKAPARDLVAYAERKEVQAVVAGAHSVSKFRKIAFGSTTEALLKNSPVPLFLHS